VSYSLPSDVDRRPIAVVGAGTLGRRIATVYASGGSDVRIFDPSGEQLQEAGAFVAEQMDEMRRVLGLDGARGTVHLAPTLEDAVAGAWMVVEAVPENVEMKTAVFGELDELAPRDAILCSNSSSLSSSRLVGQVRHRERVLNTHFQMPPEANAIELMSCGDTDEGLIDALMGKLPQYGLVPFKVLRESDGFIFNRIWAAIKRECLMVVEEGVATPQDVDAMWEIFNRHGLPPFRLMDQIGLDVVLAIEEHYAGVRDGIPEGPRRLLHQYVDEGRLGLKTGRGFYDAGDV
jgi:3-hydroxybutyryl-CoA dehydrogenase